MQPEILIVPTADSTDARWRQTGRVVMGRAAKIKMLPS
jgi:hypothetical protein